MIARIILHDWKTLRADAMAWLVAAVAAAAVWKDFHAISGTRRLFVGSLAVGTILVVLGA